METLEAFRPEWERLGTVAQRLGFDHGNRILHDAHALRDRGLVETMFKTPCLLWRLTSAAADAPNESIEPPPPPPKLTPYCPPVELEGPHSGLVEQMAQRLWRKAAEYGGPAARGAVEEGWDNRPERIKTAWRDIAYDSLTMLFDLGFVGPAGPPKSAERFQAFNYCWNYNASEWQINDAEGGYVALVRETPDLEMMLAAPAMWKAIHALLEAIPADHPARQMPELQALEASLPENADG